MWGLRQQSLGSLQGKDLRPEVRHEWSSTKDPGVSPRQYCPPVLHECPPHSPCVTMRGSHFRTLHVVMLLYGMMSNMLEKYVGGFFMFSSDHEALKLHRDLGCRQDSRSLFVTGWAFLMNFGSRSFID